MSELRVVESCANVPFLLIFFSNFKVFTVRLYFSCPVLLCGPMTQGAGEQGSLPLSQGGGDAPCTGHSSSYGGGLRGALLPSGRFPREDSLWRLKDAYE